MRRTHISTVILTVLAGIASGDIVRLGGDIEQVDAPESVRRQAYESSIARVFLERDEVLVPAGQVLNAVNPGIYRAYGDFEDAPLATDTLCQVYFFHFDPFGTATTYASGEIEFDRPILGVLGRSLTMHQTDADFGGPNTLYPTDRYNREFEFAGRGNYDYFEISPDRRRIYFQIYCSTDVDQFRVLLEPICRADFNDDGDVNTLDVMAFLNAWVQQDPAADINGDGTVNSIDVIQFLNIWIVGC